MKILKLFWNKRELSLVPTKSIFWLYHGKRNFGIRWIRWSFVFDATWTWETKTATSNFQFSAKIIRIYMANYLKRFFEYYSCQSVIRETIWTTRFKNVAHAFHHFNFASKKHKENLRRALHVSLSYSCIPLALQFYQSGIYSNTPRYNISFEWRNTSRKSQYGHVSYKDSKEGMV